MKNMATPKGSVRRDEWRDIKHVPHWIMIFYNNPSVSDIYRGFQYDWILIEIGFQN